MQEGRMWTFHISTHLLHKNARVLVNLFLLVDTELTGAHVDEEEESAAVQGWIVSCIRGEG